MFLKTVVFFACVAVASAALYLSHLEPKPDKFKDVEGCYISELDAVIPFGAKVSSKRSCFEYRCGPLYVKRASCGVAVYDLNNRPDCFVVEDMDKPYPGCCPEVKCREESDSENAI